MSVTQELVPILERPISAADRARAAVLVLDWTGCAMAGQKEAAGQKVTAAFADETGPCTRIGARSASPLMAAFHNGCLGNVLEMDDVDKQAILHAAPTIIPAALAVAEHSEASGADFLNAIVKGYETTIRIGRAVGAGHYAFWHNTATCGPFGAAVAACHLLDGSNVVSAMGLAGTQAAGLWQTRHESTSMAKQLHAGHAAQAGVLAALLSAQGFEGPRTILEGEQGFFAAMCPGANVRDILKDADANWLLHDTSLKPYPACRHAHPAIDAALELRTQLHTAPQGDIQVETYTDAIKFCDNPAPRTPIEAKFSIQHCVATILTSGQISLADFETSHIHDPNLTALRARIRVKISTDINALYPAHYGARVTWGAHTAHVIDAYGDPENPMSEAAILDKAHILMRHSGASQTQALALSQAALDLTHADGVTVYCQMLPQAEAQ